MGLVRLAGELDAADARSIARDAVLHGEVEDEARARCARPTLWPRPHSPGATRAQLRARAPPAASRIADEAVRAEAEARDTALHVALRDERLRSRRPTRRSTT